MKTIIDSMMEIAQIANLDSCSNKTDIEQRIGLVKTIRDALYETEGVTDAQRQAIDEETRSHLMKLRFASRSLLFTNRMLKDTEAALVVKYANENSKYPLYATTNDKQQTMYILESKTGYESMMSLADMM